VKVDLNKDVDAAFVCTHEKDVFDAVEGVNEVREDNGEVHGLTSAQGPRTHHKCVQEVRTGPKGVNEKFKKILKEGWGVHETIYVGMELLDFLRGCKTWTSSPLTLRIIGRA
jgi:hypothetical protein